MKHLRLLLPLLLSASVGFLTTGCGHKGISKGQQALDTWAVQNLMSEHEYYHAAGMNLEEVDALWVSPTGENAKTACFFSPGWVMQGVATVRKNYGEGHQSDKEKAFEDLKKAYPELAGMDAKTSNIGGEFAMHTSTTPVIEVAGDGKTAKGIWYSPGLGLTPHVNGDSVQVGSIFFWEKYAGDFVKENGQWKIWHLGMYYDFTPSFPDTMTERLNKGTAPKAQAGGPGGAPGGGKGGPPQGGGQAGGAPPQGGGQAGAPAQSNKEKGETMTAEQIAAGGMLPNPYKYPSWSPDRKAVITPKFPEPYDTFSNTFSYGPYDSNNQYNAPWNK
jgi:SnoaL-like domain